MKADMFIEISGGYWKAHPIVTVEEWQAEVAKGDTRLGYWQYVEKRMNGQHHPFSEER